MRCTNGSFEFLDSGSGAAAAHQRVTGSGERSREWSPDSPGGSREKKILVAVWFDIAAVSPLEQHRG